MTGTSPNSDFQQSLSEPSRGVADGGQPVTLSTDLPCAKGRQKAVAGYDGEGAYWDSIHQPLKRQEKTRTRILTRLPRTATLLFGAPFSLKASKMLGGPSEKRSRESNRYEKQTNYQKKRREPSFPMAVIATTTRRS